MIRDQQTGVDTGSAPAAPLQLPSLVGDKLVVVATREADWYADAIVAAGARDVLMLARTSLDKKPASERRVFGHYSKATEVWHNNASVAVLDGSATSALFYRKAVERFRTILVPHGPALAVVASALIRWRRRGRVTIAGSIDVVSGGQHRRCLVLHSNVVRTDHRRQHAPARLSPFEIVRGLEGLDHAVLRWADVIAAGQHDGDIDLLVAVEATGALQDLWSQEIGTYPIDIYTEDGSGGFHFTQVPYFVPHMARRMLASARPSKDGIRVAAPEWQFLSFAYHLMFHIKSRRVPPGTNTLSPATFTSPKYLAELERLAAMAGQVPPRSFDDIEAALKRFDAFPGIDLIGFYAKKNPFLQARYLGDKRPRPGLATFFVREFGASGERVSEIRKALAVNFEIVAEGPVTAELGDAVRRRVRGGNWTDASAPGGRAEPIHYFVCWDASPRAPSGRTRSRYPNLDNDRILTKYAIRSDIGDKGHKAQSLIHSSDNSAEAMEHIEVLGLSDRPTVATALAKVRRGV